MLSGIIYVAMYNDDYILLTNPVGQWQAERGLGFK
jgi:hypothetical protein